MFFATFALFGCSFPDIHLSRDLSDDNGRELVYTEGRRNEVVGFPINGLTNSGFTLAVPDGCDIFLRCCWWNNARAKWQAVEPTDLVKGKMSRILFVSNMPNIVRVSGMIHLLEFEFGHPRCACACPCQ